ncbi:MAG TPA: CPBP family glutamic-type intramembrane protease, partial [Streptosporangiaceae bacterium]|nr:CPBP family glutamic-type intramembrane protease [Streptosporangiaceae bacterium]
RSRLALVSWREVAGFTAMAYVIALTIWAPLWPAAVQSVVIGRTTSGYDGGPLAPLGMFAPALAALLMRVLVSREGVRGSLGPLRRWRWSVLAVLVPIVIVAATIAVATAIGLAVFHLGGTQPTCEVLVLLLVVGTPVSALLAFGEEYGWRGYLLPRLLPLGEVRASVVVALIWAPWYLPVLLVGLNFRGKNPLAVLAMMTAGVLALSLLFTRFFVAAGGAVVTVALLHGSLNAFSDRLADPAHLAGDPFVVSVAGVVGILVTLAAVGVRDFPIPASPSTTTAPP